MARGHCRVTGVPSRAQLFTVLGAVVLLGAWQLLAVTLGEGLAASPLTTIQTAAENAASGQLALHLGITIRRALLGFGLAMAVGVLMGVGMGLRRLIDATFDSSVYVVMTIPSIAWMVIFILTVGPNDFAGILTTASLCAPFFVLNVREGVRSVERSLVTMARSFQAPARRIVRSVIIPSIAPYLFGSVRYVLTLAWQITLITEFVGLPNGVGRVLDREFANFHMDQVFAWILPFTLWILFVDNVVVKPLDRRIFRWRPPVRIETRLT
jgi:NitT/TauT family transport system permease protein